MIRLARRASLLVAFYLPTSAATAYAEGAWVCGYRAWRRTSAHRSTPIFRGLWWRDSLRGQIARPRGLDTLDRKSVV